MTFSQTRFYYVLFVLVICSWLISNFFEEEPVKIVKQVDHTPEYYSTGYYKKEMDQNGLIKNELVADKMVHYSDDGTTHLENPIMTLFNQDKPMWVIESEGGILESDRDNLLLTGQVVINRAKSKRNRPFKLTTSELKVKLSTNYAKTNQWVEIKDSQSRTVGVGMKATFVEPVKLKFLSRVKGRYEVN